VSANSRPGLLPTLDELVADPAKASALPRDAIQALFVRVNQLNGLLLGCLLAASAQPESSSNAGDRFLDAYQVGAIIGKSRSWVEKNTDALPKRRRVGGEGKWSEREIQRWMQYRENWD
jgi:predicted DNA-binding transcriptional regulator AlpA